MKYLLIVNNDEWIEGDDDCSFENVKYEIEELLRSGYIAVETIVEVKE